MRKNHNIIIRVTKDEKEELKERAKSLGFDNLTSYVKWCTKEKIFNIQKRTGNAYQNGSEN